MTVTDAAEKVAANPVLGALARVGMFLTPILVSIGMFVVGQWLDGQNKSLSSMDARIASVAQSTLSQDSRLTTVETRINIGQATREQFQNETKQALKEQAAVLTQILQTQAAILARLEDQKGR